MARGESEVLAEDDVEGPEGGGHLGEEEHQHEGPDPPSGVHGRTGRRGKGFDLRPGGGPADTHPRGVRDTLGVGEGRGGGLRDSKIGVKKEEKKA